MNMAVNKIIKQAKSFFKRIIPDKLFLKLIFKKMMGYYPNLRNPKTVCEKTQWLKLHDRSPLHTLCADKFLVRDYIKNTIGEEYLIPLIFQSYNLEDVNSENLPNFPFVIKANHDNSGVIFVYDKSEVDWTFILNFFKKRLKRNYYYVFREWQYKNIKPCIIVEKMLLDDNGKVPSDLKAYCFNGKVEFIQVDKNRGKQNQTRNYFKRDWTPTDFIWGHVKSDPSKIEKPLTLNRIIELSEFLAKEFIYVRIDWYEVDGKLYFGEITFHPGAGYDNIEPPEQDAYYANLINLNNAI